MKLKKGNHVNKQPLYPEKLETQVLVTERNFLFNMRNKFLTMKVIIENIMRPSTSNNTSFAKCKVRQSDI